MFEHFISRMARKALFKSAHSLEKEVERALERTVRRVSRSFMISLASVGLILISLVFLLGAVFFFSVEYLGMSASLTLLVLGVILLGIGLLLKVMK